MKHLWLSQSLGEFLLQTEIRVEELILDTYKVLSKFYLSFLEGNTM
jgi:hypothetical protein